VESDQVTMHAFKAMTYSSLTDGEFTSETVGDLFGSLAFVRAHHSYGQHMSSNLLAPEDYADVKKVQQVLAKQLRTFLESQGVSPDNINVEELKEYLTGEPVWFMTKDRVIRVPMMGVSQRSVGFKVAPLAS
jgi:hypothetical protein